MSGASCRPKMRDILISIRVIFLLFKKDKESFLIFYIVKDLGRLEK